MATLTLPRARPRARRSPEVEPPETFPKGRTCARSGCWTLLCIYNPGPNCFCHTKREPRPEDEDPETAHPGQWESE